MREKMKSYFAKGMAICMLASLSLVACTKHPSKEQLQALEEARKAAAAAEAQLAEKRAERDALLKQLQDKKAALQKAQAEKAAVSARMSGN
jgi:septal ring factor EnvC (AmiA/AmiB activator)